LTVTAPTKTVAPIRPEPTRLQNLAAPIRPPPVQPPPASVGRVFAPPPGELRFRPGEVVAELPNSTPPAAVATILRNHRLVEAKVIDDVLLGTSVRLWRFPDARAVPSVLRELGVEAALLSVQPNYIYELEQATPDPANSVAPEVAAPKPPTAPEDVAAKPPATVPETAAAPPSAAAPPPAAAPGTPAAPPTPIGASEAVAAKPPAAVPETAAAATSAAAPSPVAAPGTPGAPPTPIGASEAVAAKPLPAEPADAATTSAPAASETAAATSNSAAPAPLQYSLAKLNVDEGMLGDPIRVAVIDTAVDETHPDLVGVVEARFNGIDDTGVARSLDHGTSIAGAIAGRGPLKGVAPNVRILSARAFDNEGGKAKGDTISIVSAINWAVSERALVVNMSFAGPQDSDLLHRNLAAALAKGAMLVAAAGNAGPHSPPLYPAADESVFAVTATDIDDKPYSMANVGRYIAVAAPGVDVVLPAPRGSYSPQTGTSVSAALVTGVVALLIERRQTTTPAELRRILTTTATPLGTKAQADQFGAGLVDARRALSAATAPPTN